MKTVCNFFQSISIPYKLGNFKLRDGIVKNIEIAEGS